MSQMKDHCYEVHRGRRTDNTREELILWGISAKQTEDRFAGAFR